MKQIAAVLLTALTLTACSNLRAQLVGGGGSRTLTYAPSYKQVDNLTYTFTIAFLVEGEVVEEVTCTPGAQGTERGHQTAFCANVRTYLLPERHVKDIVIPVSIGQGPEAAVITKAFQEQALEKLQMNQ